MAYDEDIAGRIRELLADVDGVREQRMFGGLAFLIGGHMAVAASGQGGLLLRVAPDRTDDVLAQDGTEPFVMRGRAMEGWVRILPDAIGARDGLARWVGVGVDYASGLPPKDDAARRR